MVFTRTSAAAVLAMIASASAQQAVTMNIDLCDQTPSTVGLRINTPGAGEWWTREPYAATKNADTNVWTVVSPADTPAGSPYKWIIDGTEGKITDESSDRCKFEYDERNIDGAAATVDDIAGCEAVCPTPLTDEEKAALAAVQAVTLTIDMCHETPGSVGLLINFDGDGNWWERAPIMATKAADSNIWTVVSPDNTPSGAQYKWIVDGNAHKITDESSPRCQILYDERNIDGNAATVNDIMGCTAECPTPTFAPDSLTFTFDACAEANSVTYQVSGDYAGQSGNWWERGHYIAVNTADTNTWTLTFPLTIDGNVLAVPPSGATYKVYVDGVIQDFDDNADLRCSGEYNERSLKAWEAPMDMIGCNSVCPEPETTKAPFAYKDHHHCAIKGMKYEKGTGTAVPSFVATAEACQDFCAADTSMPCGYFNYDMEAESCTLFTDIGAELPSGNDWFAGARGFVTGGPDCTVKDALDAESVAINGAKGCFRANSIFINADYGTCGGASGVYAELSGSVFVSSDEHKATQDGFDWMKGINVVVEPIMTATDCQVKCAAEDGCDFFDWTGLLGTEAHQCWLKKMPAAGGACTVDNAIGFNYGKVVGPKVCPEKTKPKEGMGDGMGGGDGMGMGMGGNGTNGTDVTVDEGSGEAPVDDSSATVATASVAVVVAALLF